MNIAFLLQPKNDTAFLYDDFTLRQGLEKMKHHGYTAIPVIDREGKYVTTISEGDFLWFILRGQEDGDLEEVPVQTLEDTLIREVMHVDKNPPVPITASTDELVEREASNRTSSPSWTTGARSSGSSPEEICLKDLQNTGISVYLLS